MSKRNYDILYDFLFDDQENEMNEKQTVKTNRMIQGLRNLSLTNSQRNLQSSVRPTQRAEYPCQGLRHLQI